jgi:hypothetical protein
MHALATSVDLRKHPRAQLRLPARIRWPGPLGMRLEVAETIDVSREGLLVYRNEACDVPSRVWVAFPFEPAAPTFVQPETPARIVRVEDDPAGGFRVGMSLPIAPRGLPHPARGERRSFERVPFALPIFVRPAGTPWPEESMAQGLSHGGTRFETSHIYVAGDIVLAQIPWGEWANAREIRGRVVRVEAVSDGPGPTAIANPEIGMSAALTSVAVEWVKAAKH